VQPPGFETFGKMEDDPRFAVQPIHIIPMKNVEQIHIIHIENV